MDELPNMAFITTLGNAHTTPCVGITTMVSGVLVVDKGKYGSMFFAPGQWFYASLTPKPVEPEVTP